MAEDPAVHFAGVVAEYLWEQHVSPIRIAFRQRMKIGVCKYLVFDRPGGHIDVKVNHAGVQEDRSFPSAEFLNNVLKHSLIKTRGRR